MIDATGFAVLAGLFVAEAFFLWMLVDCVTREADRRARRTWIAAILLLNAVGALGYLVIRRAARRARSSR